MAPEKTRKGRPASLRTGMELRMDLETLGGSLGERLMRDIGMNPETIENVRQQANASENRQKEDIMAKDSTPDRWPSEPRGWLDDVADAVRRAGFIGRLGRFLEALRGSAQAVSPQSGAAGGQMSATLEKGQCLALDGSLPATVECLSGAAWITCPAEGKDVQLRAGQAARIESPANMVVAALGGPARIRMGWS